MNSPFVDIKHRHVYSVVAFSISWRNCARKGWRSDKDRGEAGPEYVAPAFSFLRRFNRLNKTREAESGYLRDARKNSVLEEAYKKSSDDKSKIAEIFLRGVAFAWEKDPKGRDVTDVSFPNGFHHACAQFSSQQRPFNQKMAGCIWPSCARAASRWSVPAG